MIPTTRIIRLEENYRWGTFGVFIVNSEIFCFTLELADKWNEPNVSCIPAQQYLCRSKLSSSQGMTYEILNVPHRSHILFHAGNTVADTKGCILLGETLGKLRTDERAILNSGKTFKKFMEIMKEYQTFHLTVKEEY